MKKYISIVTCIMILFATLLSGCARSGARQNMYTEETYAAAADMAVAAKSSAIDASSYNEAPAAGEGAFSYREAEEEADYGQAANADRYSSSEKKLIRSISVSLETEEYDSVSSTIKNKVKEFDGYMESCNEYRGSYQSMANRSADMTVRIPADKTDAFLQSSFEKAYISSFNENTQDVTLQYSDLSTKKKSLTAERDRLLQLMEKAEDIESIIALEERLTEVRYELESIESSLRSYDNKVTYTTVWIYLNEVKRIVPAAEASFVEKIRSGFAESTSELIKGLENFVIWFISNILTILLFALIVFLVIKGIGKIRQKKINNIGKVKKQKEEPGEETSGEKK